MKISNQKKKKLADVLPGNNFANTRLSCFDWEKSIWV